MRILHRSSQSMGREFEQAQVAAIAYVNETHGKARRRFITVIEGQDMLYMDKHDEAVRYLAEDPEPTDLSAYDLLPGEVGITGPTIYEVAQIIVNTAALWRQKAGPLETVRLGAINAIEQASTLADISATLATFQTGMEALDEPPGP